MPRFSIFLKLELILILCIFKNCERPRISVDDKTIQLLERLSLVDFANVEGNLCKLDLLYLRSKTIGYVLKYATYNKINVDLNLIDGLFFTYFKVFVD